MRYVRKKIIIIPDETLLSKDKPDHSPPASIPFTESMAIAP